MTFQRDPHLTPGAFLPASCAERNRRTVARLSAAMAMRRKRKIVGRKGNL